MSELDHLERLLQGLQAELRQNERKLEEARMLQRESERAGYPSKAAVDTALENISQRHEEIARLQARISRIR